MASIPTSMRSLVAPHVCGPAEYEVIELPVPKIVDSCDVLVRIHAAAINTADLDFANKITRLFTSVSYGVAPTPESHCTLTTR